jgi:ubiquitin-conjugating enzyme E2 J2
MFPPDYPFAPPAIRMHTPSGRFQPSTRLCLSISDFHPKSFNPAWEVSTILIGLLSFMTSEEMTTGSVGATEAERKWAAARTRWWNSTGGGSSVKANPAQKGNVKAGDGGAKFRAEWPELHAQNMQWLKDNDIDLATGNPRNQPAAACSPQAAALGRRPSGSTAAIGAVVEGGQVARDAGQSWIRRNKLLVAGAAIFTYVLIARILGEGST